LSEKRSRGHDFSFCELDFDDEEEEEVRLQRNQRILELQALGIVCTAENLYRTGGKRVYLLIAKIISNQGQRLEDHAPRLKDKSARPNRSKAKFERR